MCNCVHQFACDCVHVLGKQIATGHQFVQKAARQTGSPRRLLARTEGLQGLHQLTVCAGRAEPLYASKRRSEVLQLLVLLAEAAPVTADA
jgi:hypothetical protein